MIRSAHYGYGMDGSIYHFEDAGVKTVPDEIVDRDSAQKLPKSRCR